MNTPKLPPLPGPYDKAVAQVTTDNLHCVIEFDLFTAEHMNAHYLKGYNDALAAIQAQGVPDGWQLVPKEPTIEMLQAALDYHSSPRYQDEPLSDDVSDSECYAAMLASAPPAPQATELTQWKARALQAEGIVAKFMEPQASVVQQEPVVPGGGDGPAPLWIPTQQAQQAKPQPLSDEQKQQIANETGAGHSLICLVESYIHGIKE